MENKLVKIFYSISLKSKVNGRRTPSDGKSSHCLWQGELKRTKGKTTIYKTYT